LPWVSKVITARLVSCKIPKDDAGGADRQGNLAVVSKSGRLPVIRQVSRQLKPFKGTDAIDAIGSNQRRFFQGQAIRAVTQDLSGGARKEVIGVQQRVAGVFSQGQGLNPALIDRKHGAVDNGFKGGILQHIIGGAQRKTDAGAEYGTAPFRFLYLNAQDIFRSGEPDSGQRQNQSDGSCGQKRNRQHDKSAFFHAVADFSAEQAQHRLRSGRTADGRARDEQWRPD
jgi:hypothetical protein